MKENHTIAVIPARSGSKGVIDKNIKPLGGKPLLAYTVLSAKAAKSIDKIFVSTDSVEYADIAKEYGIDVPFLRPEEISRDNSTDYECIAHLLNWLKDNNQEIPEYIVHLRPTTPFRDAGIIDEAVELMKRHPEVNALRSVHETAESACKYLEIEGDLLKQLGAGSFDMETANMPRQHFKKTYKGNGYVDVLKTSFILESGTLHGDKVLPFITAFAPEVDTVEDFEYLEYLISRRKQGGTMQINLRHTGIVVDKLDESVDFYCNLLGFEIINQQNETGDFIDKVLGFKDIEVVTTKMKDRGGSLLELLDFKNPAKTASAKSISSIGPTHIALTVDNIDALYKELLENNICFISEPQISQDGFARVAFCRAPEGTYIELVEELT